jgi:hypothetical protein
MKATIMISTHQKSARAGQTRGLVGGRLVSCFKGSSVVKTGLRSLSLIPIATAMLLSISSIGCVVAATGTDTGNEKSETQELDSTSATATGDVAKIPDHEAVKAGGQGGGPDPSPWRQGIEAQSGGGDGPDPSPWEPASNAPTTNTTRK